MVKRFCCPFYRMLPPLIIPLGKDAARLAKKNRSSLDILFRLADPPSASLAVLCGRR